MPVQPCMSILWMEEILHPALQRKFLTARTPFLTLAFKASRNKFVPMMEILHCLRQNSCQYYKGGVGMHRHVIEEAYDVGGARFPPSTVWMYSAQKNTDAVCVCVIHVVDGATNASCWICLLPDGSAGPPSWSENRSGRRGLPSPFRGPLFLATAYQEARNVGSPSQLKPAGFWRFWVNMSWASTLNTQSTVQSTLQSTLPKRRKTHTFLHFRQKLKFFFLYQKMCKFHEMLLFAVFS